MSKDTSKGKKNKVSEPQTAYAKNRFKIFNSFSEQEEYELKYAATLSHIECLEQMRKLINRAYSIADHTQISISKNRNIRILKP